ncbi:hypothetical protein LCGC14_1151890, partial [marine sediment metagenome]
MRQAVAIFHCVDAATQAKLAAMMNEPEPVNVMVPWNPIPVAIAQAYEDYHHEKMVDRLMQTPPTRSRNY